MDNNRIKLAVIGHRGFPDVQGGVEKHCETLMPLLSANMDITVYRRKPYLTSHSNKRFPNIRYVDLPSTKIIGFEALFHTFISCIHIIFHRPDVTNIHNIGPGLFSPLLRLFGIKIVLTYHSPNYEHAKWNRAARLFLRFCERIALNSANHIIFVNKFQLQKYSEKIKRKASYIPNGINKATRSSRSDFLKKYNLTPANYILAVGRLTPEKGFDVLIRAINQCSIDIPLVIAGANDHNSPYIEQLKDLDINRRVIFTGFTHGENLRQLYSHARLFILSSINEGFPLVMLEAMSYNLPMLVTDIPATHLVNLHPSQYIKANDVMALKDGIQRILNEPHQMPVYDFNDFQWPQIAAKTQMIYSSLFC